MPGVMGFFGHPAFLAVTAVIAIGIVAYEFYQSHKAQNISLDRRRRRRSNDEGEFLLFERYESTSVRSKTESSNNVQHSRVNSRGLPEVGSELRRRKYTLKINGEQHSVQDETGAEVASSGESSSNEGRCECDMTASCKPLHPASPLTDGNVDDLNPHAKNSEICSRSEDLEKCKDNIEHVKFSTYPVDYSEIKDNVELICLKLIETRNFSQSASKVEELNECNDNTHVQPEIQKETENNVKGNESDEIVCSLNSNSLIGTSSQRMSLSGNVEYKEDLDHPAAKNMKSYSLNNPQEQVLKSEKGDILCRCCRENTITTIVLPCSHRYMCEECAPMLFQRYNKCPICRSEIKSIESV